MICCDSVVSFFFFFKQKTAYDMRISDWSSDVCSSDLVAPDRPHLGHAQQHSHAARTVQRSRRGDAREDPPPYPDRLRMSDAAVLAAPEDEARWQRLHPATLALAVVALDRKSTRLNSSH